VVPCECFTSPLAGRRASPGSGGPLDGTQHRSEANQHYGVSDRFPVVHSVTGPVIFLCLCDRKETNGNSETAAQAVFGRTDSARAGDARDPYRARECSAGRLSVDGCFLVGRLGASAVAAVSVSFALGSGLAMAGATLAAQYMGASRQDMVDHVTAQTMVMVAINSAVLGALGYGLSPYLLTLLGVASDVYAGALGFMRVSFVGIIFVFMYAMFQALMRAIGQTKLPLYIVRCLRTSAPAPAHHSDNDSYE
jgi:hypothetical protein